MGLIAELKRAQTRSIRRTDVDRHVARVSINLIQANQIIINGPLNRCIEILADVDTQDPAVFGRLHTGQQMIDPQVVEAHAIDNGLRFRQAKNPRLGITGLRARRHGADLHKPEPQLGESINRRPVLIQACGQPYRIRELKPHDANGQLGWRLAQQTVQPQTAARSDQIQRQIMRGFRGKFEEQLAGQVIHGLDGLGKRLKVSAIIAVPSGKTRGKCGTPFQACPA